MSMTDKQKYRDNGAIGALLDEYERSITELKHVITDITPKKLTTIVDSETKDPSCRSIQTILTHVVTSGNWFIAEIRKSLGERISFPRNVIRDTTQDYQEALTDMFANNEKLFEDYPDIQIYEADPEKKIKVKWGQLYDVEQLFEHAILHILRHRRQIERFLIKIDKT